MEISIRSCESGKRVISADTGASWITEAMKKYPYTAETTDEITVKAGTIEKKIPVKLTFKLVDRTWSGKFRRTFFWQWKYGKCIEKAAEYRRTAERYCR